jgi:cellulose synthase/poly-beta-1,6-N-acetylglucosamine synthase-like glycosyltransferase
MVHSKIAKLMLTDHGSYLGMEKGCFTLKDKSGNVERYPLFEKEIGEVILKSGNAVSTSALASLGFWDIDVLVLLEHEPNISIEKEIIVIDDFSKDGTREILSKIRDKEIKVLYHDKNYGKGHAIRTGIKAVTGDIVIIQDADLEYDPMDYLQLIVPIVKEKAKVVYGTRFPRKKENFFPFFHYFSLHFYILFKTLYINYFYIINNFFLSLFLLKV